MKTSKTEMSDTFGHSPDDRLEADEDILLSPGDRRSTQQINTLIINAKPVQNDAQEEDEVAVQ